MALQLEVTKDDQKRPIEDLRLKPEVLKWCKKNGINTIGDIAPNQHKIPKKYALDIKLPLFLGIDNNN